MDRTQMETLAESIQLAINWGIEQNDDEQSVVVTVEEDEDDGHLYWHIADSYDWRNAETPAGLLVEAAQWVVEVNEANRQHAEDAAEDERLDALVEA